MKRVLVALSVVLLSTASFSSIADARPGKGKAYAYGHQKHHKAKRYVVQQRSYRTAPRYVQRRSNNGAIAAGVAGAIIGGALGAAAQPTYRSYERPSSQYYSAPRRSYYSEEYYDDEF